MIKPVEVKSKKNIAYFPKFVSEELKNGHKKDGLGAYGFIGSSNSIFANLMA